VIIFVGMAGNARMRERVAIILAAGISRRMNTEAPKVLHEVCGKPMLAYVLDACRQAGIDKLYVVVGFGAEQVREQFAEAEDIVWVEQADQKGTAHAVMCCREQLDGFAGETYVLCGDGPLLRAELLEALADKQAAEGAATTLATAILEDPTGYGRIVRGAAGDIEAIVEHNDCTNEQLRIKEVNPSYYLFDNRVLFEALEKVRPDNVKGEYYLTDAVAIVIEGGHKVSAVAAVRSEEAMSANTPEQLAELNRIIEQRIARARVEAGSEDQ
jgi:bifunctional UDP-N-acetylglucosamine pyrophosphorylase/glucosamine-1-phosphate N-acetyltransferase